MDGLEGVKPGTLSGAVLPEVLITASRSGAFARRVANGGLPFTNLAQLARLKPVFHSITQYLYTNASRNATQLSEAPAGYRPVAGSYSDSHGDWTLSETRSSTYFTYEPYQETVSAAKPQSPSMWRMLLVLSKVQFRPVYDMVNSPWVGAKTLASAPLGYSKRDVTGLAGESTTEEERIMGGASLLSSAIMPMVSAEAKALQSANVKYLGRLEDLNSIPRNQTILDELTPLSDPRTNYYRNMSVIRRNMREGFTFEDASWNRLNSDLAPMPGNSARTLGQSGYGAERMFMKNRGLWP